MFDRIIKRVGLFLIFTLILWVYSYRAYALGECGLSCCIAGALSSGGTLAPNFGLTLQYENTVMKTIREGRNRVSPDAALDNEASKWDVMPARDKEFSVPTEMRMEKWSLLGVYPATERFQVLTIIPFIRNEMDMRMVVRDTSGETEKMDHAMDPVGGLGDVTIMGLYTAYTDAPIRPLERLTLGIGAKTPTGKNDEETSSGSLIHAMMQSGTGSWDPIFLMNYMRAFYPVVLQGNLVYQFTTRGDEGYEFGDQITMDLIARYQAANYVNMGLEINGLYAGEDEDHDGKYSSPDTSILDNTANTGIRSVYMSPTVQLMIPGTPASIDIKHQLPLYQDANGIQEVIDRRWLLSASFAF